MFRMLLFGGKEALKSTVRCLRNDGAQSWGCVETRDVAHGSRKTGLIGFLVVETMRRGIFCTKNDGSACPTAPFSFKPMFLTTKQAGKKKNSVAYSWRMGHKNIVPFFQACRSVPSSRQAEAKASPTSFASDARLGNGWWFGSLLKFQNQKKNFANGFHFLHNN